MISSCNACPGFVPAGVDSCPHCGAAAPSPSSISTGRGAAAKLLTVAKAIGGSAVMMTLMACYGISEEPECTSNSQCASGFCNVDYGSCTGSPENCHNGVDDDGDGIIDCNDSDCQAECASAEGSCSDGLDGDHDGLIDCLDPDCSSQCGHETSCINGIDDDHDGLIDCADSDCASLCGVHETNCFNGIDDDGDGAADCNDPDCQGVCTGHETICNDGIDNDQDGLVDCSDADCAVLAICGGHELDCGNGVDDDHDGLVDCTDSDCPACATVETLCQNGFDDDQDGLADCDDPDCALACSGSCGDGTLDAGESCDDGNLVSGDGCSQMCGLEVDAFCSSLPALAMGGTSGSTGAAATNGFSASCIGAGGPERAYSFVAPQNGTLYLTVDAPTDLGLYVELGCGSFATEVACTNVAPAGQLESLEIAVPAGAPLTVFVDGASPGTAGNFVLVADFVVGP